MNNTSNKAERQPGARDYPESTGPIRNIAGDRIHEGDYFEMGLVLWASTKVDLRGLNFREAGNLKNVLVQLCICANEYEEGYFAYPGYRKLADRTNLHKDTVGNLLYVLWSLQLISIYRRKGKGRASSFLYEIHKGAEPVPRFNCPSHPDSKPSNCPSVIDIRNTSSKRKNTKAYNRPSEISESGSTHQGEKDRGENLEVLPGTKTTPAPKPPPPSDSAIKCIRKWRSLANGKHYPHGWLQNFDSPQVVTDVEAILSRCNDGGIQWPGLLIYLFKDEPRRLWADKNSLLSFPSPGEVITNWDSIVERMGAYNDDDRSSRRA